MTAPLNSTRATGDGSSCRGRVGRCRESVRVSGWTRSGEHGKPRGEMGRGAVRGLDRGSRTNKVSLVSRSSGTGCVPQGLIPPPPFPAIFSSSPFFFFLKTTTSLLGPPKVERQGRRLSSSAPLEIASARPLVAPTRRPPLSDLSDGACGVFLKCLGLLIANHEQHDVPRPLSGGDF